MKLRWEVGLDLKNFTLSHTIDPKKHKDLITKRIGTMDLKLVVLHTIKDWKNELGLLQIMIICSLIENNFSWKNLMVLKLPKRFLPFVRKAWHELDF